VSGWTWLWLGLGAWCALAVAAAFAWSVWRSTDKERYRAHADQAIALTQEQR
jgi:hypothetical protein